MGYGIIDSSGQTMVAVAYGCIEPPKASVAADRLLYLHAAISQLIVDYKPDTFAIEELYFMQNVTNGLKVAEARGVAILAARQANLAVAEYKPTRIKSVVSGYGHATKPQMQKMVQMLLKLKVLPKPDDAADGLAIAICHAVLYKTLSLH